MSVGERGFCTSAVHAGCDPEPSTGAIVAPIYMTSTYVQEYPTLHKGYDYTRAGNPNFSNLEKQLCAIQGCEHCTVMTSGLSCVTAIVSYVRDREGVIVSYGALYGGTHRLLQRIFCTQEANVNVLMNADDTSKLKQLCDEENVSKRPKLFIFESPTNPLLECVSIDEIINIIRKSKAKDCLILFDNTFATPYHQRNLNKDIDFIIHSSTKYISGHSDTVGGCVLTNNAEYKKQMDFYRMAMGLNPSPFDCWLLNRSLKTLPLRLERQSYNAAKIAEYLEAHKLVSKVMYPGLKSHATNNVASAQMKNGFGAMVSVVFNLDLTKSMEMISSFKVFTLAESLGAVESLVDHPASMTHASIPKERRDEMGLADGLIRFSIGIEDVEDLIADLEATLRKFM